MRDFVPHLAAMLEEVVHDDPDSTLGWCDDQTEFEFGLDILLEGLERRRVAEAARAANVAATRGLSRAAGTREAGFGALRRGWSRARRRRARRSTTAARLSRASSSRSASSRRTSAPCRRRGAPARTPCRAGAVRRRCCLDVVPCAGGHLDAPAVRDIPLEGQLVLGRPHLHACPGRRRAAGTGRCPGVLRGRSDSPTGIDMSVTWRYLPVHATVR